MTGRAGDDRARDSFGSDLALADLDGDGSDELAVLTQDFPGHGATGAYWIVPGSPRGPLLSRAERLDVSHIGRG